jgi:AraC-like DNA-binding protein
LPVISTLFRSEDHPREERFDRWCEVCTEHRPAHVSTGYAADFHGSLRSLALGAVELTEMVHSPLLRRRDPAHVRRRVPQGVQVHLVMRGVMAADCDQREDLASAGEMLVTGSWHPYVIRAMTRDRVVEHLTLNVPHSVLAVLPQWTDGLRGRRLPATGTSTILANLLKDTFAAADQGAELNSQEAAQLGNAASSLLAAIIAHHADRQSALPPETRRQVLLQRIHAFIDAHLADPALSPQTVADAHHLSLRHLHRLFQQGGTGGVSAWIRHRRLEHCRLDLIDPRLAGSPISAVAARWGFAHPADFTRAFRSAYHMAPSDYRAAALYLQDGAVR